MNAILSFNTEMNRTIEAIPEIKRTEKQPKNVALLLNITEYRPLFCNRARWSGEYNALRRLEKLKNRIILILTYSGDNLPVLRSALFGNKVRKYMNMLCEIDVVIKSLQTKGRTISARRDDLEFLIESVRKDKVRRDSPHFQYD